MKHFPKYLLALLFLGTALGLFAGNFKDALWVWLPAFAVAALVVWRFRGMIDRQPFSRFLLVFAFMFIISVPLIGKKETESYEKRALAEFPQFRLGNPWKFFFGFTDWFNDRFAFRNDAVQSINKFRFRFFLVSTQPNKVEVGKNGWLFTSRPDYVDQTSTPFTYEQLDIVENNLEIVTKYFDLKGIKFYFTMIPVKERIYPEYMGDLLKIRMKVSKQEQLAARIKNNPNIRFIDGKEVLINGKSIQPTFYSTDTHWNQFGAFLAYRNIIARIKQDFQQITPSELSDYKIENILKYGGDLQLMMGFKNELQFHVTVMRHISDTKIINTQGDTNNTTVYNEHESYLMPNNNNGLSLFLVRDSFSQYLKLFICRDFSRSDLVWTPKLPVREILAAKPDVVLQEMLEMFVMNTLELPEVIKNDQEFMEKYYPEYKVYGQ